MKQNLFEISEELYQAFNELEEFAEENEGEIPDHLFAKLEVTQEDLDDKLEAYSCMIMQKMGEIDTLDEKIADLIDKKKQRERHIENMKNMLAEAAKRYGKKSETGNYKLTGKFRNVSYIFSKPLVIDNINLVPDEFKSKDLVVKNLSISEALELETIIETQFNKEYSETEKVDKTTIKNMMKNDPTFNVSGVYIDRTKGSIRFQ